MCHKLAFMPTLCAGLAAALIIAPAPSGVVASPRKAAAGALEVPSGPHSRPRILAWPVGRPLAMKVMRSTPGSGTIFSPSGAISGVAYQELTNRVTANQSFYVYLDEDSGLNHGFPSGSFSGNGAPLVTIDPGCIDNSADTVTSCFPSTDTTALDLVHGTVFRVTFPSESGAQSTGLNIEEPEDWGVFMTGSGYNLTGAANIAFDVRSPDGISLQFGVGGCTTTAFAQLPASQTYTTMTIPISSLVFSGSGAACPPDLSNIHVLFTAVTNAVSAPNAVRSFWTMYISHPFRPARTKARKH